MLEEPTGRDELLAFMDQQREAGIALRTISWTFRDKWDGAGRRVCVWCGRPLPPGKRQQRWCSGEKGKRSRCVEEFEVIKGDMGQVRVKLRAREKEQCQGCHLDLKALERVLEVDLETLGRPCDAKKILVIWERWRGWFGARTQLDIERAVAGFLLDSERRKAHQVALRVVFDKFARRSLWQADHIRAVEDGGSGTDLSNFQLLCTKCHLAKTNEAKAKKASAKRIPHMMAPPIQRN